MKVDDIVKNFLGIIGGLGPEATSYFYNKIIKKTKVQKDQDHIDMVIFNHASTPNRNDFIMGLNNENPYPSLSEDVKKLTEMGATLIVITCNTAHYFYDELQNLTNVKIVNIIENTARYLKEKGMKKVGILATSATIELKMYQQKLKEKDIEYVIPTEINQQRIMSIIYEDIKKSKKINKKEFQKVVKEMKKQKVEAIIMGCTELSLLKENLNLNDYYVDPLNIVTSIVLDHFNKEENK